MLLLPNALFAMGGTHPKGPLGGTHGDWPAGLPDLINSDTRVYGHWVNANDEFFYQGNTTALNQFLQMYSKLPDTPLRVVTHPGPERRSFLWGDEPRLPYEWKLLVVRRGWGAPEANRTKDKPAYVATVDVWADGNVDLRQMIVPNNVDLEAAPPPTATQPAPWGKDADGLRLSLSPADKDGAAAGAPGRAFILSMQNTGSTDLMLNLGMMLANGKREYATRITVYLIDKNGKLQSLDYKGAACIAGRVDDLIVPLPAWATYSLPISLDQYALHDQPEAAVSLPEGGHLVARYIGAAPQHINNDTEGLKLLSVWQGEVDSNRLPIAAPH
jgi:hypothetical protein